MILVLVSTAAVVAVSNADGTSDSSDMVLIDLGNGETYWASVDTSQTTVGGVVGSALNSLGLSCTIDGSELIIDGISNKTIGSVSTTWKTYTWTDSEWVASTFSATASYSAGSIAVGFYPSGVLPSETPDYMTAWIMARGDATQSGHQTTDTSSSSTATSPYSYSYGTNNYVCGSVLVVADKVYVVAGGGSSSVYSSPMLYCYDRTTGEELWSFSYGIGAGYETATGAIVGDYYYLPATNGTLYRIPLAGPGDNDSDVISLEISKTYDHTLTGNTYATGPSTLTYDSGVLYFGSSNGYVYCVDLSLNVIWNTAVDGCIYYSSITVQDGLVYAGALNGYLYVLNASTGEMLASADVYSYEKSGKTYGLVAVPVIVDGYIFMSFSDGQGMSTTYGGIAIYTYSSGELTEVAFIDDLGPTGTYLLPVVSDDFTGVYFTSSKVSLGRMSVDGSYEVLNSSIEMIKAGLILVNDDTVYAAEYNSSGYIYQFDMDGNITGEFQQPDSVAAWCMSPVVIIEDWIYSGTDGGFYSVNGELTISSSSSGGISGTMIVLAILICLIVLFAIYCVYIKKTKNVPPIAYIAGYLSKKSGFNNDRVSKTKQNKRRLLIVLIFGVVLTFI
ncbi:MAG: PQQ-binding-like beta-propeller repeat protein, partial [Prevotella sp.]